MHFRARTNGWYAFHGVPAFQRKCGDTAERVSAVSTAAIALIAWIGVLAVAAIAIAFLLPALLREIDYGVARDESATLRILDNAVQP